MADVAEVGALFECNGKLMECSAIERRKIADDTAKAEASAEKALNDARK